MCKADIKIALQFIFLITKKNFAKLNLESFKEDFDWVNIYNLFKAHDLAHLFAYVLQKKNLLNEETELGKNLLKDMSLAIYRYTNLINEQERVKNCLNEQNIPFIFLKGVVMRRFYNEPWLRTSSDVDVLVEPSQFEFATKMINELINCTIEDKAPYDVSMHANSGVRLEIHSLIESDTNERKLLNSLWETAICKEKSEYLMTNELFYFYHIAHMARHFKDGGCGIKPFIDLLILKRELNYNEETVEKLLTEFGLKKFETCAVNLANAWASGKEEGELKQMEKFVLFGGTYGTLGQYILAKQSANNKRQYLKTRIFMPYSELKKRYKVLEKHRWLTPLYEVVRWTSFLNLSRAKRATQEIGKLKMLDDKNAIDVKKMLDYLELK